MKNFLTQGQRFRTLARGVATIELLIAFALAIVFITGAAMVSFSGQSSTLDVVLTGEGMPKAQSYQRAAVAEAFGVAALPEDDSDVYAQDSVISQTSDCMTFIRSGTDWTSEADRAQGISFGTLFGDIAEAKAQGGACDSGLTDDDYVPGSLSSVDVSGADGTGIDVRSISGAHYAFITADPSAAANPDFIVVDVSDPESISSSDVVAELNTGPGLNGVVVVGTYAYVLQNKNTEQLQVIDISIPGSPTLISSATRTLPDLNYTCSPASQPCKSGRSIAYRDSKIYIGTQYLFPDGGSGSENKEFYIYDVSTPTSPSFVGGLNVNHNVNAIEIDGNYAYLATSDDTGELMVVDISDPSDLEHPDDTGMKFNARTTGGGSSTEDGWSIDVVDDYAYFGRERTNSASERDFYVLKILDPTNITIEGAIRFGLDNNTYLSGVAKKGNYAFLSTTDANEPLFVIDVSDTLNPFIHDICNFNFSQVTRGLVYHEGFIFTVNRSNDLLRILYDQPTCS